MKTIAIADVIIPPRQREKHAPAHIADLKLSIQTKGLLHPPVLTSSNQLVAGMGRFQAVKELHEDGLAFSCDNEPVELGRLPYLSIGDLSPADLAEAELEENLLRADLSWQEQTQARVLVLNLRRQLDPQASRSAVAAEIAERSGKSVNAESITLMQSELVAKHLNEPRVAASKSLGEAHRVVQDMITASLQKELVQRKIIQVEHRVILGDCLVELGKLPTGSFDTILCDPPYGIDADKMKKSERHLYDDSPANALKVATTIISEGFRLLKPRGIVFLFCDFDHFLTLREHAGRMGYTTWRSPVIWHKGEDGHAPWGRGGFIRTYEIFALFVKGAKELKAGGPDVKRFTRPARSERAHAAEKPIDLLVHLLSIAGNAGDTVLDPCCGSGPTLAAASRLKMRATGIELDPEYHAQALARLANPAEEAEDAQEPLMASGAELLN